jgi:hypothetical protein
MERLCHRSTRMAQIEDAAVFLIGREMDPTSR